jgi:hypothetical protein
VVVDNADVVDERDVVLVVLVSVTIAHSLKNSAWMSVHARDGVLHVLYIYVFDFYK